MRSVAEAFAHHVVGLSVLMLTIAVIAVAQHFMGSLTIPVMDQKAAESAGARSTIESPVEFPIAVAPAAAAPGIPIPRVAPEPAPLLGEVHLSAGDLASRPADPTPADPLRIAFASGVQASVRVTVSADDGVVVATVLENPSAPAGAREVEWNGTSAAGAPVPGGRYTLGVAALEDVDVYRMSVQQVHLYIARPGRGTD